MDEGPVTTVETILLSVFRPGRVKIYWCLIRKRKIEIGKSRRKLGLREDKNEFVFQIC